MLLTMKAQGDELVPELMADVRLSAEDEALPPEEKKQLAQKYVEHEFVIHGEKIMARNKKTAMKIYANRHKK